MKTKIVIVLILTFAAIIAGIAAGSVSIPPFDIAAIFGHKAFNLHLPEHITPTSVSILWDLRLPRTLLSFITGAALSVSGVVMQSVLRNPLASSYTLGVSSGASLGACIVILYGIAIPFAARLTLPLLGFLFGVGTIFAVIMLTSRFDKHMENNTVILAGMVLSLFINAITTLLSALSREHMQRLIFWQMGSFSSKDRTAVLILAPILIAGTAFVMHYNRELDIMTFGEEQAKTIGINLKRTKRTLLITAAALTGSVISFVGVIGFVDLIIPHITRKLFGSRHRFVIPVSALIGGAFMIFCDLAARTVVSPGEFPVGAVTAIIGAPFFVYVYFRGKKC